MEPGRSGCTICSTLTSTNWWCAIHGRMRCSKTGTRVIGSMPASWRSCYAAINSNRSTTERHHRSFRDPYESQRPRYRHPDLTRDHTRCVDRGNPHGARDGAGIAFWAALEANVGRVGVLERSHDYTLGANGGCKHDVVPEAQELNTALGASFEAASGALTGTGD